MPLTGKGRKIMRSMKKTYGSARKAKSVFYASRNKGRITGVESKQEETTEGNVKKLFETYPGMKR